MLLLFTHFWICAKNHISIKWNTFQCIPYCTVLCNIQWMEAAAHIGISTNDIIMKLIFKPNGQSTTKMLHFTMRSIWMVTKSEPPEKYHFSSIMEVRKLHKSRKLQQIFFTNIVCFSSCTQSFLFMLKLIHCGNAMDYHFLGKLPKASQSVLQVTANFGIILLFSLFVLRWMHLTSLPFSETHYVTQRNRMNWGWKLSFCSSWSKHFESKSRSFMQIFGFFLGVIFSNMNTGFFHRIFIFYFNLLLWFYHINVFTLPHLYVYRLYIIE